MKENKQAFKALSKICLNNWHYIEKKVLSFSEGINFFTGHSGSGKSTVIDALQIVLYANTDGRGFFNKAAADDSDRSLIEYLRGMISVGDNNEVKYIRNRNFSTTIVLELEQTVTGDKECVGVVFDVETATNEISRLFFWHKGGIPEHHYRKDGRAMAASEVREYIQTHFVREEFYFGTSNERFRRQLYDIYLGGLDADKFPRLFKRAIPFKMNIKLEDFVREYICMEQDIQIEDMQESVLQYGRMRKKIEDTLKEISSLKQIRNGYDQFVKAGKEAEIYQYRLEKLMMLQLKEQIKDLREKMERAEDDKQQQEESRDKLSGELSALAAEYDGLVKQIANSGFENLKTELKGLNELLEQLTRNRAAWQQTCAHLERWKELEATPNQTIWDIESFSKGSISLEELRRLRHSLKVIREEVESDRQEASSELRKIKKREKEIAGELGELKKGNKAYPKELENARYELQTRLSTRFGRAVRVHILADLLDMRSETWHKAVEGYLGSNKLALVVEPDYAKAAMEIYREMDQKTFFRVSVLDTERVQEEKPAVAGQALAEEVITEKPFVRAFVDLLLGRVIKCHTIDELRQQRTGVTPDCLLYKNFQLKRLNPADYTKRSYIGESSMKQRIKDLEQERRQLEAKKQPFADMVSKAEEILALEALGRSEEEYLEQQKALAWLKEKTEQKKRLEAKMQKMKEESIDALVERQRENKELQAKKQELLSQVSRAVWTREKQIEDWQKLHLSTNSELTERERIFQYNEELEQAFEDFMKDRGASNYENLKNGTIRKIRQAEEKKEEVYRELVELRSAYLREYPNRTFSPAIEGNEPYEQLLSKLECDHLADYQERAREQARSAAEHFKDDFISKIRYAILEAYQRRDELNRIISRLDFGKDKYQFRITKNKGPDGIYYPMFMDESLQIDPSTLDASMDHQMNLFSMEHESRYGEVMSDLIDIFIPPENASAEELDEAKRNMEKYADYRTYLSFDMEQIVEGEEKITIGLSRMIKKNSGGEGQNPLYVALLASFAQAYRINLSPKIRRSPTIRLVVLDEAFSKMDAEKVASCIELIRGLGFQAIISATNDKIQNYLENVDKTFVYANPNKKSISIQEFEKREFKNLLEEAEDEEGTA
ncbi:ATP-binding protein [Anaerostipes sp.]|uniref:ATP-binding protein n=1 Tax=Anaerostipes sp. TaxID=1872530 RepID=UPI0025C5F47F|nr:SbcC/MukB-like Walker B domain-containing protein [Anaerostipes sp.]MBS7007508.1 AAA family ATPase [Anaerostipes sp.]